MSTNLISVATSLGFDLNDLPYSLRIVFENVHRNGKQLSWAAQALAKVSNWRTETGSVVPMFPNRIVMPDSSGIPVLLDMAALRSEVHRSGGSPDRIRPAVPVDVIIDHSMQVDEAGTPTAPEVNLTKEFIRNTERYRFLKWAQQAFGGVRVFPPGSGIIHQINLEYLSQVVTKDDSSDELYPEFVLGADSHTPMINGIGVLGWGVGGLEIESVLLGHPYMLPLPEVLGVELTGELPAGSTSTDLVLQVTQLLRRVGVVGSFVEFFGDGLGNLTVPDRATIANMSPESGATATYFPVDQQTLDYLAQTGRPEDHIAASANYLKANGLFREPSSPAPKFSSVLRFDLSTVQPAISGPYKPQQRLLLNEVVPDFNARLTSDWTKRTAPTAGNHPDRLPGDGAIVIASISSCTNTSNPSVMLAAGLLAKRANDLGLRPPSYVKTSLTPGSRAVTAYLDRAGLSEHLDALGFFVAGYGCATCGGKSGPLNPGIDDEIVRRDLAAMAVLSGNRNFPGRIHRFVKGSYLASPPLVIAYALAGRIDIDLNVDPLGYQPDGTPVFLRDLWPDEAEVQELLGVAYDATTNPIPVSEMLEGPALWRALDAPVGPVYDWDPKSAYLIEPPFFSVQPVQTVQAARVLATFGDSLTTDHISPSGEIPPSTPAGKYLLDLGVTQESFNTYVGRRGNHHVMVRGTFANVRLKNQLVPGVEGGFTRMFPSGERTTIFEAAEAYRQAGTPLVILGGKEYGTGSSRDWASKGTALLGVRAVIAESYERIHRTNLAASGVLPLRFISGDCQGSLGLDGSEEFFIEPVDADASDDTKLYAVTALRASGEAVRFTVEADVSGPLEWSWLDRGGVLPLALSEQLRHGRSNHK